ncbi:MAG: hypothetical protein U1E76_08740 [Planctomycetota bacterium]
MTANRILCHRVLRGVVGCSVALITCSPAGRADHFLLRDGRTVAGAVRSEQDAIAVQTLDGMVTFARGDVLVRDTEAELRAVLRTMLVPAREHGAIALVPLMHWCEQRGLLVEWLALGDEVLARAPGQPLVVQMVSDLARRDVVALLAPAGSATDPKDCSSLALEGGAARQQLARELLRALPDDAKSAYLVKLLRDRRAAARARGGGARRLPPAGRARAADRLRAVRP